MLRDTRYSPPTIEATCPDTLQGRTYIRLTIGLTHEEHLSLKRESRRRGIAVAKLARMAVVERKVPE